MFPSSISSVYKIEKNLPTLRQNNYLLEHTKGPKYKATKMASFRQHKVTRKMTKTMNLSREQSTQNEWTNASHEAAYHTSNQGRNISNNINKNGSKRGLKLGGHSFQPYIQTIQSKVM